MSLQALDTLAAPPAAKDAGRSCPLHYRYRPERFAVPPAAGFAAADGLEVLYVVGGLYGNAPALDRVLELFEHERGPKRLVFNGDFHWFNADVASFEQVQRDVLAHVALRGNVETELASAFSEHGDDAGCGCAYPDWVGDGVVERSNHILARLRQATTPAQRAQLAALPMTLRADVGGVRLAIVHGDAQSLAGWGFAQEHLRDAAHRREVSGWFERAEVAAFVCSHTCLPVFQGLRASRPMATRWVLNNGAAGLPNFSADGAGLLTRIALRPFAGAARRYGVEINAPRGAAPGGTRMFAEAIAIQIDEPAWQREFLRLWPAGSDAHQSYFERITRGPDYCVNDAVRVEE